MRWLLVLIALLLPLRAPGQEQLDFMLGSAVIPECSTTDFAAGNCGAKVANALTRINNGATSSDCVTGGGSILVWCWYDSGAGILKVFAGGGGATSLDELTDVIITAPATDHVIQYNGSSFVNQAFVMALGDLTNVVITTPGVGEALRYDGVNWINQVNAISEVNDDPDTQAEIYIYEDNTPTGDFRGVCIVPEGATRTAVGTTSVCWNHTFDGGSGQAEITNGYCQTVGYVTTANDEMNILECVFDPGGCSSQGDTYCNTELQAFLDAVEKIVEDDDDGWGTGSTGVRIRFPRQFIRLDMSAGPIEVNFRGVHFDCTNRPYFVVQHATGAVPTYVGTTATVSVTQGDATVTCDGGTCDWCGGDYDPNDNTQCDDGDETVRPGNIFWLDKDADHTYPIYWITSDTTLELGHPYEKASDTLEAFTVSTGGAFYITHDADNFTMSGECLIWCYPGGHCIPKDAETAAGNPTTDDRDEPMSVIVAAGTEQRVTGFRVGGFTHKNDFGILGASEPDFPGDVEKFIGGASLSIFNPDVRKYMRTGLDPNDPTDNGRGAAFASLAGLTTFESAIGRAGTMLYVGGNTIGISAEIHGENSGRFLWAPGGGRDIDIDIEGDEQDLNCDDGGSVTCETDFDPFIDIGAPESGTSWDGFYDINAEGMHWFGAERPIIQIEDQDATLNVMMRIAMDSDPGVDVIQTAATGIEVHGLIACEDNAPCTIDSQLKHAGLTLCPSGGTCTLHVEDLVAGTTIGGTKPAAFGPVSTTANTVAKFLGTTGDELMGATITNSGSVTTFSGLTPTLDLDDASAADHTDNVQLLVDCSDAGSGTEDCDLTLGQYIGGNLLDAIVLDADGKIEFKRTTNVTSGDLQVGGTNVCQSDGTNCGRPAADKIIICGPLLSSGTNYYQPMLAAFFGDTSFDWTMGGGGAGECDTKDSTNPLVDAAVFADVPFEATGMYCKVSSSGTNGVTLTLRVEGADATPSLACTIATGTTECFTGTDTTTDIGAGDQISVRSVTTEDLSAHDAWCLLYMELK